MGARITERCSRRTALSRWTILQVLSLLAFAATKVQILTQKALPADTRVVTGSLSAARTLLQPLLCGGAGGSALERETACNTSEAFESAWRARVELLSQCGVLSDVASMRMTAAGPSARAAAGRAIEALLRRY